MWDALLDIAPDLGDRWTLIGGQMVLLHQMERGAATSPGAVPNWRLSGDADLLINIRSRGAAQQVDAGLRSHGFAQVAAPIEHRYARKSDDLVIDVLAPDHLGEHLPQMGSGHTLQAPGGTQALDRTEWVRVDNGRKSARIPRPSLVGAILIKCSASLGPAGSRGNSRHLGDLDVLSGLLERSDIETASLTTAERNRLRQAARLLRRAGGSDFRGAASRLVRLSNDASRRTGGFPQPPSGDAGNRLPCTHIGVRSGKQCLGPRGHRGHHYYQ